MLCEIYSRLGDRQAALCEAEITLKLAPGDAGAQYNLGSALHALNRFGEALSAYNRAIELGYGDRNARRGRALCLLETGDAAGAVFELEKLSSEAPGDRDVWVNLGWAYAYYGDGAGAWRSAERAISIDPDYYPAWRLKVELAIAGLRTSDAAYSCKHLIRIEPHNPISYWLEAKTGFACGGGIELARQALSGALANCPQARGLFVELGKAYGQRAQELSERVRTATAVRFAVEAGQWNSLAGKALNHALSVAPDSVKANVAMAEFLCNTQQNHRAYRYAARAIELDNGDESARKIYQMTISTKNDLIGAIKNWLHGGRSAASPEP